MYKKFLCWMLAFALVLVSGGDKLILSVDADSIADGVMEDSETVTMMPDFADDSVLVVLTHEASLQFIDYTPADFPEIELAEIHDLSTGKGAKVQAVLRGEQLDMDSIGARFMNQNIDVDRFRRILSLKLANPGKGNVLRATAALGQREDVYSAEPNYIIPAIEPQAVVLPEELPPYGWAASKIQQEAAWEIETGSSSVKVGVLDTGIDVTHPELNNKVNTTLSRDFVGDGFSATEDPNGHGTHVAGIIGAKYNNDDLNFSGVCQNVTLVSLRVLDRYGYGELADIVDAINHADQNNISILNLSLSTMSSSTSNLQQATTNYSGLMVCSAGNEGNNINSGGAAPACFTDDHIISVGASTSGDTRWGDSNYGNVAVDLFAPGDSITSCYPRSKCASSGCSSEHHVRYGYHTSSGTSMAAPFVTGVAALILAHNSLTTPEWIKEIIIESVDKPGAFNTICVSGGRLNALSALSHPGAHDNTTCSYVNALQHRCTCPECGINWLEDHMIHPGLGTCMLCDNGVI